MLLALAPVASAQASSDEPMTELVVTSQRREQPRLQHAGNIDSIDSESLMAVQHHHIHELLTRVSGVWLSRGSGQEHLTAIRSPVLTGAGSCGAFLFLEDGIQTAYRSGRPDFVTSIPCSRSIPSRRSRSRSYVDPAMPCTALMPCMASSTS